MAPSTVAEHGPLAAIQDTNKGSPPMLLRRHHEAREGRQTTSAEAPEVEASELEAGAPEAEPVESPEVTTPEPPAEADEPQGDDEPNVDDLDDAELEALTAPDAEPAEADEKPKRNRK